MFSLWSGVWGMGKAKSYAFERPTNGMLSRESFARLPTTLGIIGLLFQPVPSTDKCAAAPAVMASWLRLCLLGISCRYGD